MHVVVALYVIAHAVPIQAGDEGVLAGRILRGILAEQGIDVILADQAFVAKDERVTVRRLARERGVDPGLLQIDGQLLLLVAPRLGERTGREARTGRSRNRRSSSSPSNPGPL